MTRSKWFIVLLLVILFSLSWFLLEKKEDYQMSDDQGIEVVRKLPEVQEFKDAVERNGRSSFQIEIEEFASGSENINVVRVFEVFSDHQTTFNRYRAGKGVTLRYNGVSDVWERVNQ